MQPTDDSALLRQYAENNSDEAFAMLVTRHIDLVYSVALRQVANPHHAEEITQAVFIILAKKAVQLRHDKALSSWLFQAARLTASNFIRSEARRHRREEEAYMQSVLDEAGTEVWPKIAPLLDAAVAGLREQDRRAILLRFYESRNLREVGVALGASEDAAEKRVSRALEKLREFFTKRGVSSTTSTIAGAISAHSVQAVPVALAKSVTVVALAKGAAAGGSVLALAKGALQAMAWAKLKFACGVGAAVLLAGSAVTVAVAGRNSEPPDPVALLKKVAAARNKIKSGEMEFLVARHNYKKLFNIQTNYALLKVAFDGEKRRFEQLQREIVQTSTATDGSAILEAKRIELNGDAQALARLGLIWFGNVHYRTVYDGKSLIRYEPNQGTMLDDPAKGSITDLFDPRTLGLSDAMFPDGTVENCLAYQKAQSVSLVGKEEVAGISAWHVKVQAAENRRYEFWIDVEHPTHVVKQKGPNCPGIMAKFDEKHPDDPIPVVVDLMALFADGPYPWETRMVRRHTRFNVPIDPRAFTLAGLGMSAGTPVADVRIHQRIGYWTGSTLSEDFPGSEPPHTDNAVSTAENDPESVMSAAPLLGLTTDGSYVDERKIIRSQLELGIFLPALICVAALTIKRFRTKAC